jgi:hypothetical protein
LKQQWYLLCARILFLESGNQIILWLAPIIELRSDFHRLWISAFHPETTVLEIGDLKVCQSPTSIRFRYCFSPYLLYIQATTCQQVGQIEKLKHSRHLVEEVLETRFSSSHVELCRLTLDLHRITV